MTGALGIPDLPPDEEARLVAGATFEHLAEQYMDGKPFNNYLWDEDANEGIVDFYLDRDLRRRNPMSGQRQRRSLEDALHRHDLLKPIKVTTDTDTPCGLRFFNLHFPLDKQVKRRLAMAANVVSQWRKENRYSWL